MGKVQIGEAVITEQVCCLPEGAHSVLTVRCSIPMNHLLFCFACKLFIDIKYVWIAVYIVNEPDGVRINTL